MLNVQSWDPALEDSAILRGDLEAGCSCDASSASAVPGCNAARTTLRHVLPSQKCPLQAAQGSQAFNFQSPVRTTHRCSSSHIALHGAGCQGAIPIGRCRAPAHVSAWARPGLDFCWRRLATPCPVHVVLSARPALQPQPRHSSSKHGAGSALFPETAL